MRWRGMHFSFASLPAQGQPKLTLARCPQLAATSYTYKPHHVALQNAECTGKPHRLRIAASRVSVCTAALAQRSRRARL
eukprot:15449070-Alexandrium_andersonii.AAC.1